MVAQHGLHPNSGFETTIAVEQSFESKVADLAVHFGFDHPHQVIECLVNSAWRNVESSKMQPVKQAGNLPGAGRSPTITQGTDK